MHILVTGACGTVGARVVKELAQHGHFVRAVDNRPLPEDVRGLTNVAAVYLDIADPLALLNNMADIDAVAHLAAIPNLNAGTNAQILTVNVVGTQNILDAAEAHGVEKVVLTSSIGALGFSFPTHPIMPDYLPIDVNHPRRPQDVYGVSKVANETSAEAWTRRTGKTTIVLRPPAVFNLQRAKTHGWLARGPQHRAEQFNQDFWSYVDVRDLAVCFRHALEENVMGHHVFFAMADDVFATVGARELIERHMPDFVRFADNLTGNSLYDLVHARDILGFSAEHTWRSVLDND